MAERMQVYKCDVCGNIVFVLDGGVGDLTCCDEPMKLMKEKTADASTEKHVPVVEKIDGGFKVKVGSVPHPMADDHWIEWIEISDGDKVCREFLSPRSLPEATFLTDASSVTAREYCNKHGLWKA